MPFRYAGFYPVISKMLQIFRRREKSVSPQLAQVLAVYAVVTKL
jgi:hypothetical protein